MTTILKAAQQLEGGVKPAAPPPRARGDGRRRAFVVAITSMLLGLACGGLAVRLLLDHRNAEEPPVKTRSRPARIQVVHEPPPVPPAPRVLAVEEEVPWGRVEKGGVALPASASAPAIQTKRPVASVPDSKPESAPPAARAEMASVPGEPGLQVLSLAYSSNPIQRTVTLHLGGTRSVTLHEGEAAGGVEVQLILPKVVYLRRGGSVFAVGAAR